MQSVSTVLLFIAPPQAMGACQLREKRLQSLEAVDYPNASQVSLVLLLRRPCIFLPHIGSTCLWFKPIRHPPRLHRSGRTRSESLCPGLEVFIFILYFFLIDHHFGQGDSTDTPGVSPIHVVEGTTRGCGDPSTDFETVNACILI